MAHTALKNVGLLVAMVAFMAPARGLAEPVQEGSRFYAFAQPAIGYSFGTATYEGPVFSGATSTERRYEARFGGLSFVATVGGGYRLSPRVALGARALAGLAIDPSWKSNIPGSGLKGYAAFGAEMFGRSMLAGDEGPAVELAIGYAQLGFAAEPDAFLLQGGIQDAEAFRTLRGLVAGVAIGWVFVQRPWTIEPRVGLRYFNAASDHGDTSVWMPSAGVAIGLGGG